MSTSRTTETVYAGMTRCSKYSGHDQAAGVPADLPKFTEIEADFNKLNSYVVAANTRRKKLEDEGRNSERVRCQLTLFEAWVIDPRAEFGHRKCRNLYELPCAE